MGIYYLTAKITLQRLKEIAEERFGDMVKGVVDVENKKIVLGGDLHADEEAVLLERGSKQNNLWGFNLYPDRSGDAFIEFDSMINIRPSQGNRSRDVENPEIRKQIVEIVNQWIQR